MSRKDEQSCYRDQRGPQTPLAKPQPALPVNCPFCMPIPTPSASFPCNLCPSTRQQQLAWGGQMCVADLLLSCRRARRTGCTLTLGSAPSLLNWLHPLVSGHLEAGAAQAAGRTRLCCCSLLPRPAGSVPRKAQPDPVGRWRPLDRTLGTAGQGHERRTPGLETQ